MSKVIVLGSLNEDLVIEVDHAAAPGETILARSMSRHPGGKGANQAVAAARFGAQVEMLGAVGDDEAGRRLIDNLEAQGIGAEHVRQVPETTGLALVTLDSTGENSIVVVAGANRRVTGAELLSMKPSSLERDIFVTQLEIASDAVARGLRAAREKEMRTVLNAAPAADIAGLIPLVDVLIVNETEAAALSPGYEGASAARQLSEAFGIDVVLTLGADGAFVIERGAAGTHVSGVRVDAVDTTGAGDTFVGVLAAELAGGSGLARAAAVANAAAALACTAVGAQSAMPDRAAVAALRESR